MTQQILDPQQEFIVLAESLGQRKCFYFTLLAEGYSEEEAAERIGLKKETIRQTWKWSEADGFTFRRCLEMIRANPSYVEPLKIKMARAATLNAIYSELIGGYERKDGTMGPPRADVIRLGAEVTQLVNYAPTTTVNQLNVVIRESMGELAAEMQKQLTALHGSNVIDITQSHALVDEMVHSKE